MTEYKDTLIIGGGLSGLTIAHKLRTSCYGHSFAVLEKNDSTGGVIRSHNDNGFIAEWGPHGFLDNCKESREILEECDLDRECLKSPLLNFVRYVRLNGALKLIPQSPGKILGAPLIPWKDKLRVLGDLFQKPLEGEPTVAQWVDHRFGGALLPFADAVFTGTYAGDMDRLTIDSVMPGVRKLELEHGSVIKGVIKKMLQKKKTSSGTQFRMPAMTSFPEGMERLPQKLTEYLQPGKNLHLNCEVTSIQINDEKDGWEVQTNSTVFTSRNLVLAIPTNSALSLLAHLEEPPLQQIPESEIVTVVFGFGAGSKLPPGFGYLTPEVEKRFSLGTLFSSNMFPGRAPSDHILFETLVGGRRHPERLELPDDELIKRCYEDVRDVLDLHGDPVYTKVLRPWGPIPQLEKDYPLLLEWRNSICKAHQGLHICGFGWEGIGLNDMMKHGVQVAEAIRAGSQSGVHEADVKGVYF